MCGFLGSIHFELEINKNALSLIDHRGPDDMGYFEDGPLFLGHTRLSIIDVSSAGHQPMFTEDKRYCIVFNGEIYNHLDIRSELMPKYTFRSHSDTETILYGFEEYGVEIFNKLNGIFAFALYDNLTKDLYLVRDHFGVKPFYYYDQNGQMIFGSELKTMTSYPGFDKTISPSALVNYINFLWSPGETTPFIKVKKLEAGHYIKMNVNQPKQKELVKFYDIDFTGIYSLKSEAELIDILDKKLELAVSRQLMSDVPVGFFLSGGLDSSLVVAYARKINPLAAITCFTIDDGADTHAEGFSDDLFYAKKVAEHLNVDLKVVKADIDIVRDFDKMIYHLDEPQADPAPLNVLNICTEARKLGFKVLLGGTAGDDLFSGYRRHQAISMEKYYRFVPQFVGSALKFGASFFSSHNPKFRRIKKALNDLDKGKQERLSGYFSWISLAVNKGLFSKDLQQEIKNYVPSEFLLKLNERIPNEHNDLNKMLYWEMKSFLVDHNLNYTDKMSMAVGVETRVPYLDRELVDFSTQLPPELKLKGATTKYLLKKVAERYLPLDVIYRPKTGFGAPIRKWIVEDMADMIAERLSTDNINRKGLFNPEKVHDLIRMNKSGEIDASYTIWSLLAIESWYDQFYEN